MSLLVGVLTYIYACFLQDIKSVGGDWEESEEIWGLLVFCWSFSHEDVGFGCLEVVKRNHWS